MSKHNFHECPQCGANPTEETAVNCYVCTWIIETNAIGLRTAAIRALDELSAQIAWPPPATRAREILAEALDTEAVPT